MNPRILKKLSKRADPFVAKLAKGLTRFETGGEVESIDSSQKIAIKYRDHWAGKPNEYGYFTPKKRTVGYGHMAGYYEREWEEDDAFSILQRMVADHFTDWRSFDFDSGDYPKPSINVNHPSVVFKHAPELLKG